MLQCCATAYPPTIWASTGLGPKLEPDRPRSQLVREMLPAYGRYGRGAARATEPGGTTGRWHSSGGGQHAPPRAHQDGLGALARGRPTAAVAAGGLGANDRAQPNNRGVSLPPARSEHMRLRRRTPGHDGQRHGQAGRLFLVRRGVSLPLPLAAPLLGSPTLEARHDYRTRTTNWHPACRPAQGW
jgi:hypothetical protein